MNRIIQIILTVLITTSSVLGIRPTFTNIWDNFTLESPLPFTAKELLQFKNTKVKSLTYYWGNGEISIFMLNEEGTITSEKTYLYKKNRMDFKKPIAEGNYVFNKDGHLISADYGNSKKRTYYSIRYNDEGRIIYYYSHSIINSGKKQRKLIHYNLNFLKIENNCFVLSDTSLINKYLVTFTLDKNNKVIKGRYGDNYDSLSFETDSAGFQHTYHWNWSGCEESIYKDGLIVEKSYWQKIWPNDYKIKYALRINYHYDENHVLQSIIPNQSPFDSYASSIFGPYIFYTYYPNGLLKERITISKNVRRKKINSQIVTEKFYYGYE